MGVGARQTFQFFRQVTWLLINNGALSKFKCRVLHYRISIIKKSVRKSQFHINHVNINLIYVNII